MLVVASLTAGSQDLLDALKARAERSPIRITLVMPAQGPGFAGREAQRAALDAALEGMREAGLQADGVVGDANPMDAVVESFDPARHDEAIVCTLPGRSSKWLQHDFPHRVARFTGVTVTHVVAGRHAPRARYEPGADARARAARAAVGAVVGRPPAGLALNAASAGRSGRGCELEHAHVLVPGHPRAHDPRLVELVRGEPAAEAGGRGGGERRLGASRDLGRIGGERPPVGDPARDDPERVGALGRLGVRGEHEPGARVGRAQDAAEPAQQ